MTLTINYNGFAADKAAALEQAIINAFNAEGVPVKECAVTVAPPFEQIALGAEWRVNAKGVADIVCLVSLVRGEVGQRVRLQMI